MKILLVNEFYSSRNPSGENRQYKQHRQLLQSKGHSVLEYTVENDGLERGGLVAAIRAASGTPWNPFHLSALRRAVHRERPDLMHVHNTFPLLSPAVLNACEGTGTAVVATLHNYRSVCASSLLHRDGELCTECPNQRSVLPAIKHGCYRGSRLATIPVAAMVSLHMRKRSWTDAVDVLTTVSATQREVLVTAGLESEKIEVLPNFAPQQPVIAWERRENKAVFIGRIAGYKGLQDLLAAWEQWGADAPVLEIIGEGPDASDLRRRYSYSGINWLGQLPWEETQKRLATAKMCAVPSRWLEPFGLVVIEAMAAGVPVLAANRGALPETVKNGFTGELFDPGTAGSLLAAIKSMWGNKEKLRTYSENSVSHFRAQYSADVFHEKLFNIYGLAQRRRDLRLQTGQLSAALEIRSGDQTVRPLDITATK